MTYRNDGVLTIPPGCPALLEVKSIHAKSLAELKAGQEKAIEAAKTALALENEKILKAREETLKKEAAETMKNITGGLDQTIKNDRGV